MYAVIETGNKQYRVEFGSEIQVDRLDVQAGDSITIERVLLIADGDETAIGRPVVEGATVVADVVAQVRGEKIVVFKYKPKARHRVKKGFRAELTTLRISDIAFGGRSAAKDAQKSDAKKDKATKAAKKAAADQAVADKDLASKLVSASEPVEPEAEAKPKAAASTKTKTEAKPKPEAKPKSAAKATSAAKPKAEATPKTATDTKTKTATAGRSSSTDDQTLPSDAPDSADVAAPTPADEAPATAEDSQKEE